MTEKLPKLFADQFILLERVGSGGMAEIFAAVPMNRPNLAGLVAIKRMLPRFSDNARFVDMLTAEAKIGTLLDHPHIVPVEDLGTADGTFFMVMELVLGKSLDLVLAKLRERQQGLDSSICMAILKAVALALDFAHQVKDPQGRDLKLIHRDVTPGNVLIGYDGRIKLTDFGIATAADAHSNDKQQVLGKLPYMAAEQIRRQPVTAASDLYALAVIAYELLTLRRPFQADNEVQLQEMILRQNPLPLGDSLTHVPATVEALFTAALSKEIGQRPASCIEFIQSLATHYPVADTKQVAQAMQKLFGAERNAMVNTLEQGIAQGLQLMEVTKSDHAQQRIAKLEQAAEAERTVFAAKTSDQTTLQFKDPSGAATTDELMASLLNQPYEEGPPEESKHETVITPKAKGGKATLGRIKLESRKAERQAFLDSLDRGRTEDEPAMPEVQEILDQPPEAPLPEFDSYKEPLPPVPSQPAQESQEPLELDVRPEPAKPAMRPPRPIPPPQQPTGSIWQRWRGVAALFALVCALASGGFYWLAKQPKTDRNKPNKGSTKILNPNFHVYLYSEKLLHAKEERILARFLAPAKIAGPSLHVLPDFFKQEYKRHQPQASSFRMTMQLFGPIMVAEFAPLEGAWYDRGRYYKYFDRHAKTAALKTPPLENDIRLNIYFYRLDDHGPNRYPLEYFGYRREREGIVFLPIDRDAFEFSLAMVAHEMLHLLGATDKVDDFGKPFYPQGYAEPNRQPLYPQRFAEIMARSIPFSAEKTLPITHLKQLRIGAATAGEIGWHEKSHR